MARKLRFYDTWDRTSIVGTLQVIVILSLFIIVYYSYKDVLAYFKTLKYSSETTGQLLKVNEQVIIRQTQFGNKPEVDHYEVSFKYQVGEETLVGNDIVLGTIKNRSAIRLVLNSSDSLVKVKYQPQEPNNSIIDLTEY